MFGAVPLNFKGITTKVHYVRAPSQILITKLFSINPNEFTDIPYNSAGIKSPKSPTRSRSQTMNSLSSITKTPDKYKFSKDDEDELMKKVSIYFIFILFYFILFYFILFYFILFYFILFYFILFYFIFIFIIYYFIILLLIILFFFFLNFYL